MLQIRRTPLFFTISSSSSIHTHPHQFSSSLHHLPSIKCCKIKWVTHWAMKPGRSTRPHTHPPRFLHVFRRQGRRTAATRRWVVGGSFSFVFHATFLFQPCFLIVFSSFIGKTRPATLRCRFPAIPAAAGGGDTSLLILELCKSSQPFVMLFCR